MKLKIRRKKKIFEGFANVGSDTSYLARFFNQVISVEFNKVNYSALEHNIKIMKLNNVEIYLGDTVKYIEFPSILLQCDCIYFDPPWLRKNEDESNWEIITSSRPIKIGEKTIEVLVDMLPKNVTNVILKLPYNYAKKYSDKIVNYKLIKEIKINTVMFRLLERN